MGFSYTPGSQSDSGGSEKKPDLKELYSTQVSSGPPGRQRQRTES